MIDRGTLKGRVVSKEPKNRARRVPGLRESPGGETLDGVLDSEFTQAELREFLAADYLDTHADPAFRESLRKKLWDLVSNRYGRDPSSSDSS